MKTMFKQFLMNLWAAEVITDHQVELLIHFFKLEND